MLKVVSVKNTIFNISHVSSVFSADKGPKTREMLKIMAFLVPKPGKC